VAVTAAALVVVAAADLEAVAAAVVAAVVTAAAVAVAQQFLRVDLTPSLGPSQTPRRRCLERWPCYGLTSIPSVLVQRGFPGGSVR